MEEMMKRSEENVAGNIQQTGKCYTVEDIMLILGVGRKAVYALIRKGAFRAIRIGGLGYRIPKPCFDSWLLNQ